MSNRAIVAALVCFAAASFAGLRAQTNASREGGKTQRPQAAAHVPDLSGNWGPERENM